MKNKILSGLTATFAALLLFGCTSNYAYKDPAVYSVSSLGLPADDEFMELLAGTDQTLRFSWSPGSAGDGDPVQYEVLFYGADGELVSTMDAGMNTYVTMTHKDLNKTMGAAGVASGATGAIDWTVRANRGPNQAVFPGRHKLNLRRMLGFDEVPARLFLTGAASETGAELASSREFRLTSAAGEEGEFEIYTRLGGGTFNMVSSLDGSRRTFGYIGGLLEETTEGVAVDPGIYRINVDFSVKGFSMTRIDEVLYAYMQDRTQSTPMEYVGGGRWEVSDLELQFAHPGWGTRGFEERYRFEVVTSMQNEVWGPLDAGTDGAPSALDVTMPYFTTVARPRTGDWDPKWKWFGTAVPDLNEAGGSDANPWKRVNLYVVMSGNRYYHFYEVLP